MARNQTLRGTFDKATLVELIRTKGAERQAKLIRDHAVMDKRIKRMHIDVPRFLDQATNVMRGRRNRPEITIGWNGREITVHHPDAQAQKNPPEFTVKFVGFPETPEQYTPVPSWTESTDATLNRAIQWVEGQRGDTVRLSSQELDDLLWGALYR